MESLRSGVISDRRGGCKVIAASRIMRRNRTDPPGIAVLAVMPRVKAQPAIVKRRCQRPGTSITLGHAASRWLPPLRRRPFVHSAPWRRAWCAGRRHRRPPPSRAVVRHRPMVHGAGSPPPTCTTRASSTTMPTSAASGRASATKPNTAGTTSAATRPGAFQSSPKRQMFQSDHCFDVFSSPVTNPFYFIDPRAASPRSSPRFHLASAHSPATTTSGTGGHNFDYTLVGSVAVYRKISPW